MGLESYNPACSSFLSLSPLPNQGAIDINVVNEGPSLKIWPCIDTFVKDNLNTFDRCPRRDWRKHIC